MNTPSLLDAITALSHEFGTPQYVRAGGGNTSCKTADTLWVKPSGTTLAGLKPGTFVAMDRAALSKLYAAEPPAEPAAREELVKDMMAAAVKPETPGRASVEAPLHDSLAARFVVHTHPAAVNGLTCAVGGRAAAVRLFPDALWVPYTDPGYTLCMAVRKAVLAYKAEHGGEPALIFLENHGVFVAGDTEEAVRAAYARVTDALEKAYAQAGVDGAVPVGAPPSEAQVAQWRPVLADGLGAEGLAVAVSGRFEVGGGPISPDHIVYSKSYPFDGVLTADNLGAFRAVRGYAPRVVVTDTAVLGVGASEKVAALALELALDGAAVKRLARAFGGLQVLDDRARGFIENWEVESYRSKQV
ncbi:MAG: class II aldolase/adducin family protein [Verrucomicrobiota bacterium]|jgi:rhamnose utilization protein RhaD (predicted bifunctional aldolase and dehydrogenase)|nr:class II aldolase/adducin family protein [Verrucomicrobiota bacterium]